MTMSESSQTPNEAPVEYTRHVFLDRAGTERLLDQLPTLSRRLPNEQSICLRSQRPCSANSFVCSWTAIQLCLTPPVGLVVHCERLSALLQSMWSDLNETQSSRDERILPFKRLDK